MPFKWTFPSASNNAMVAGNRNALYMMKNTGFYKVGSNGLLCNQFISVWRLFSKETLSFESCTCSSLLCDSEDDLAYGAFEEVSFRKVGEFKTP